MSAPIEALRAVDTPTVCDIVEELMPARRGMGYTTRPLVPFNPSALPMIGYARTLRIRGKAPGRWRGDAYLEIGDRYVDYLAEGPMPGIVVAQDMDGTDAGHGAFWGSVQTAIHRALGIAGAVTDGSLRDHEELAEGFPVLASSVGPSHAFVHIEAFGTEVAVAGMAVRSGDLVHADCHGAVVVPPELVEAIPPRAAAIKAREAEILDLCAAPNFTVETLKAAMRASGETVQSPESAD